jgi:hypothetical protein
MRWDRLKKTTFWHIWKLVQNARHMPGALLESNLFYVHFYKEIGKATHPSSANLMEKEVNQIRRRFSTYNIVGIICMGFVLAFGNLHFRSGNPDLTCQVSHLSNAIHTVHQHDKHPIV